MCISTPRAPDIDPPAPPPAPPEAAPESPALNEAGSQSKNEDDTLKTKRRGRSSLRIDLQAPSRSGLNIPGG